MSKGGCYSGTINANGQIFLTAAVTLPGVWGRPHNKNPLHPVRALVDTGATFSSITPEVAQILGINPIDKIPLTTADGEKEKNVYRVDMIVLLSPASTKQTKETPKINFKDFSRIRVVEFGGGKVADMLLGMDIIMQGSLEIKGNAFTFCL